ncbi:unnamed protein product [Clonostachys rosea f. rosea IK726]|uniref:Uncharacterized protein n=1 Tax=Clonostachys rosea f. rosea IK726 TaxID=1349383 RepID=A0ACA9TX36_BIOOC|nr:unnamed protein product [Clonostachys rosea f. rosea IK726]
MTPRECLYDCLCADFQANAIARAADGTGHALSNKYPGRLAENVDTISVYAGISASLYIGSQPGGSSKLEGSTRLGYSLHWTSSPTCLALAAGQTWCQLTILTFTATILRSDGLHPSKSRPTTN